MSIALAPTPPPKLLEIVDKSNPILKEPCQPVTEITDLHKKFAMDMMYTLRASKVGIGLAAPQVGQSFQLIVTTIPGKKPEVLFNPKIVNASKGTVVRQEGCLSFPNEFRAIERKRWVSVVFQDIDGQRVRRKYYDLEAQCIQHEIEHLKGITFDSKGYKL